ncbi:hypothetical protein ACGFZQ_47990 [Streptomyces sp. NPDC048254]|uniref:hypothetical protein n=1 Tax=Streptomyces sp. NPDC048254 TaxID=3365525 RepID=UPI00371E08E5
MTAGLDEADAVAYLAHRIAEAGTLVDRDRAITDLTAAAERLPPDSEGRGMLRWCQAARHLIKRPADRVPALQRYAVAAYFAGDFRIARTIAESILRNRPDILGPLELQETATLFTAATADDLDWRALSRLATPQRWDELRLPTLATATGRAPALCLLARWHEALDLLARTEPVWTTEARARANPACFRDVAELALGPYHAYTLTVTKFDELLNGGDLHAGEALLAAQGLTPDLLPRSSLTPARQRCCGLSAIRPAPRSRCGAAWKRRTRTGRSPAPRNCGPPSPSCSRKAGRTAEAVTCLERLARISDRMGTGRTRLTYLLASARALRQDSPATAGERLREAVDLARPRSQPFETAVTLVAAAAADAGAGPPALLREAYDLFGQCGAALDRFHTQTAMRAAGITVPARKQATLESEQLLATLIAEGLTNRRMATVLRLTEDAVATRLSRLFARTGLRSRTEVVTAVLTGYRARSLASDA